LEEGYLHGLGWLLSQSLEHLGNGTSILVVAGPGNVDSSFRAKMHLDPDIPYPLGLFGHRAEGRLEAFMAATINR
jgi:hypothetical protein